MGNRTVKGSMWDGSTCTTEADILKCDGQSWLIFTASAIFC